ncbi:MAG: cysteine synthase CysM [Deltaproteobacteria bacterium]|nr:cysteine synthase CysM [Deltaproteobacteria bacterium]
MKLAELIGNTPLVDLSALIPRSGVRLLGKCEFQNPGGSVKDRAALSMIGNALERGELKPGMRLIEPTSGNTGIALAMIAASLGVKIDLVMPESATKERVTTMRAYGAKVILTPAEQGMEGAIDHARALHAAGGYLMLDQFKNPDNPLAHFEGTGPEIWRDTDGALTHFISAMGTTGTIIGTSRYLKQQNPAVQIIGVQPSDGAKIPGIRRWPPAYLPAFFEAERVDRTIEISQAQAEQTAQRLAREVGIFVGISSGGATAAALTLCQELARGLLVVILCDRGDRYLSAGVFD